MEAKRIHIFGASGSGTTTLGREIAQQISGAHLDTDHYYWVKTDPPFVDKRHPDKRIELIQQDIQGKKNWVLSGSICSWGDPLLVSFTLAVFVRLDANTRMQRLVKREKERHGARIEPGGDMHKAHLDFMNWARSYDLAKAPTRSLDLHRSWAKRLNCPVIEVDSTEKPERLARRVLA